LSHSASPSIPFLIRRETESRRSGDNLCQVTQQSGRAALVQGLCVLQCTDS
jgi:hypothetical protein